MRPTPEGCWPGMLRQQRTEVGLERQVMRDDGGAATDFLENTV